MPIQRGSAEKLPALKQRTLPTPGMLQPMGFQLWQIVILAVVQGLTEFLPVSSSGHLVILGALLSPAGDARQLGELTDLNIVLHVGTLASILVHYWRQIIRLLGSDRRVILLMIVGTLPAVVVGLVLETQFKGVLESPLLAGVMLLVTGALLLITTRLPLGTGDYHQLSLGSALAIGAAQAAAILPGLSRSGSTVVAGLALGQSRTSAATFSFLLAIPAICGAAVLKLKDLAAQGELSMPLSHLAVGAVISFAVGLLALRWLLHWLEHGRLHYFALWCIPLGLVVIAMQLAPPPSNTASTETRTTPQPIVSPPPAELGQ